nr:hypothetical protein CFP56_60301 [Quercus suber]
MKTYAAQRHRCPKSDAAAVRELGNFMGSRTLWLDQRTTTKPQALGTLKISHQTSSSRRNSPSRWIVHLLDQAAAFFTPVSLLASLDHDELVLVLRQLRPVRGIPFRE